MERVKWIEFEGKNILMGDLEDAVPEDWPEIDRKYDELLSDVAENSVLSLVCVENAHFNSATIYGLKERARTDAKLIKKTALVGIAGLREVMYNAIMKFSGRKGKTFDDREIAKKWLVSD